MEFLATRCTFQYLSDTPRGIGIHTYIISVYAAESLPRQSQCVSLLSLSLHLPTIPQALLLEPGSLHAGLTCLARMLHARSSPSLDCRASNSHCCSRKSWKETRTSER